MRVSIILRTQEYVKGDCFEYEDHIEGSKFKVFDKLAESENGKAQLLPAPLNLNLNRHRACSLPIAEAFHNNDSAACAS